MSQRIIKFRAWDKVDQRIVSWDDLTDKYTTVWALCDGNDYIPMQFTGLLDQNGKEIFEGDIVKYSGTVSAPNSNYGKPFEEISKVFFSSGQFEPVCHWGFYGLEGEVIGNVYENPDLLTKGVK